jgi:porphobilinogen synthase
MVVLRLRQGLDAAGFHNVGTCIYSAKYVGILRTFPRCFRQCPKRSSVVVPKKTKNLSNGLCQSSENQRSTLGCEEGADMVMVKPGIAYLDIVRK